jgi:hypothetical protein
MAVEGFIPMNDAKQTVEKAVKPKPKLKDLIKIEKPGRIAKKDRLDNPEPKTKKKRAVKKSTTEKVRVGEQKETQF